MLWPLAVYLPPSMDRRYIIGLGTTDTALLNAHEHAGTLPKGTRYANVHLGPTCLDADAAPPPAPLDKLLANYQRRIDLVIDAPTLATIFEIKPAASFVAFGQILYYHHLTLKYLHPDKPISKAIVTDLPDPDIVELCNQHGIHIYTLPEAHYEPRGHPT